MKRLLTSLLIFGLAIPGFLLYPEQAHAAVTSIRQEINITDAYLYAPSGSYATSSEMVAITDTNYTNPAYFFEAIASSTSGTTGTAKLVNATSSAVVATLTMSSGNAYTRYRSTQFLPNSSSTVEYKVVLGNEAFGKGIIASRIVVLQSANPLNSTETQIEIGSATTTAVNTTTLPLQSPKYWKYDSTKWNASPTFYVEATYKVTPTSSSTVYSVSATTTPTFYTYIGSTGVGYVVGEAWGGGGGGDGVSSAATLGGGGGGGGAYARSTTTVAAGSSNIIGVGRGGAEGTVKAVTASSTLTTASGLILAAEGGEGGVDAVGGATSTLAASVGQVKFAGGKGGDGQTSSDTGGGGGGSAGPDGFGISGGNAATDGPGGAGGAGDKALGGAGGAAGNGGDDTCDTENGGMGVNNVLGAGGGGGADGDVSSICLGGNGGRPGGGGGGSDEGANTSQLGGPGQVKITEWIGTVGIALEESDGTGDGFQNFAFKTQIVTVGKTSTTSERVRSAAFTPTTGRNYRIVASTTNATASYDIYNAKIVVDQIVCTNCLVDNYSENNQDSTGSLINADKLAQSFTSTGGTLQTVKFYLKKSGSPTGNATAKLYTHSGTFGSSGVPTGAALATSDNFDVATLTGSFQLITFTFTGAQQYSMTNGTNYVVSYEPPNNSIGNTSDIGFNVGQINIHAGNKSLFTGGSWSAQSDQDTPFYLYSTINNGNPTKLEPQYLLAPFQLFSGTSAQNFLTSWLSTDWNTTNAYIHQVDAANNSTSVVTLIDSGGSLVTNSTVSSPDNVGYSSSLCMPSNGDLDVKATTNGGDIYSSRILVQVGGTAASCGPVIISPPVPRLYLIRGMFNLLQGRLLIP